MDIPDANLAQPLRDIADPRIVEPITERRVQLPAATRPRTLQLSPILANILTEAVDPKVAMLSKLALPLMRAVDRKERPDPTHTKLEMDILSPRRTKFRIEQAEPRFTKATMEVFDEADTRPRRLSEEPRERKSETERRSDTRAWPITEIEPEALTKERSDRLEPRVTLSVTLKREPSLAEFLIETEEPILI